MRSRDDDGFLRDIWYFALPSSELGTGGMVAKTLLGEPIVFARKQGGEVFALRDICPHRGIPLSDGKVVDGEVECCYHGWRFGGNGVCTAIPSLVPGQDFDISRIRVRTYPIVERQGCIWIFMSEREAPDGADLPDAPMLPDFTRVPEIAERMEFPCHVDHAVIGLMDPAHGPFVHQSWWWRKRRSIHEKAKAFGPSEFGFQMRRHAPSTNSAAYKLVGGEVSTEITFRLPGVRVEHVIAGRHQLCGLTAVTPVAAKVTVINHLIFWTMPWLTLLKPALRPFARTFLGQDRDIVVKQQKGLAHDPSLMLINDADTQAIWYHRLKKEWSRSRAEGTEFVNPVPERTLRWRS